jgi:hypothetical protein
VSGQTWNRDYESSSRPSSETGSILTCCRPERLGQPGDGTSARRQADRWRKRRREHTGSAGPIQLPELSVPGVGAGSHTVTIALSGTTTTNYVAAASTRMVVLATG